MAKLLSGYCICFWVLSFIIQGNDLITAETTLTLPTPPPSSPITSTPSSTTPPSTPTTPPSSTPIPSTLTSTQFSTPPPSTPTTPSSSTPTSSAPTSTPPSTQSSTPPSSTLTSSTPTSTPPPSTSSTLPSSTPIPSTSTSTTSIPSTTYKTVQGSSFSWSSSDMTDNPIVFTVENGYFISVTVSKVNMADGNYLVIQGGESRIVEATDGRIFANTVKGPLTYLFKTTSVFAYCETSFGDLYDFNVKFEQAGEKTTTISTTTTTTVSVPPTEKLDSVYITVNVSGRSLAEYKKTEVQEAFQTCVAEIAENYCHDQNINLIHSITSKYVMISDISRCPYNWPDSNNCVQITFKLPIFHDEAFYSGYLLTTEHLEVMWLQRDQLDQNLCLSYNHFSDYDEPDFKQSILWWAIGIALVIVAFVILLWFIRTFSSRIKSAIKKRQDANSDTVSILSRQTNSVCSLTPHYLQDHLGTPKFFED